MTVRSKELSYLKDLKVDYSGEDLIVSRGKGESRENQKGKKFMSKSKSTVFDKSKLKYFTCHKTNHFKKDCLEIRNKGVSMKILHGKLIMAKGIKMCGL